MSKYKFFKKDGEALSLPQTAQAKVTIINNRAEVVSCQNANAGQALTKCKRISKTQYIDTASGEVCEYKPSQDNSIKIKTALKKVRWLIYNNFEEFESFFITLTYRTEMCDFQQAVKDFTQFYNKLSYKYRKRKLEYLRIIEPTEKGVWHIHMLIKDADDRLFHMLASDIEGLWQHGSVELEQTYDINGLVMYLTTVYSSIDKNKKLSKTQEKQLRWKYYPRDVRIYSKSKGIVEPASVRMTRYAVSEYLKEYKRTDSMILEISDSETENIVNKIQYESYYKETI